MDVGGLQTVLVFRSSLTVPSIIEPHLLRYVEMVVPARQKEGAPPDCYGPEASALTKSLQLAAVWSTISVGSPWFNIRNGDTLG